MAPTLSSLTAADIMKTDVVVARYNDSLQEAMSLMTENHVTGLPVLDSDGHCVGVVSASDILGYEQEHTEDAVEANNDMARHFDPDSGRWEDVRVTSYALEEFADLQISEIMSHEIVAVAPNTAVQSVARRMVDEEVHRVLVVDPHQRLLGVISSVDFVRLVAELP